MDSRMCQSYSIPSYSKLDIPFSSFSTVDLMARLLLSDEVSDCDNVEENSTAYHTKVMDME
jgi:hypothetical protein